MAMEITETTVNGVPVLQLSGRLDGPAAPGLEKKVMELIVSGATRMVFDCSGVEYASSAGLRVFLVAARQLQSRGGRCSFAALTPGLHEVFTVSGFLDILDVHDTAAQAAA